MDTVKEVMIFLLLLAVIGIALFLGTTSLDTTIGQEGDVSSETFTSFNSTGGYPTTVSGLNTPVLTSLILTNGTASGEVINSGNYTNTFGLISATATSEYENTTVVLNYSYTDLPEREADDVTGNVTNGTTGFFTNIPTVFTILGAVVIILAVTLILFAVNRFSGGNQLSSEGSGSSTSSVSRL